MPPGGGVRRSAPKRARGGAAAVLPVAPPLATTIIGATVGIPGPGSATGSDPDAIADLERAADRAKAIQTKNRENQRRHRERQRSKLAAAEERVADLETELGASRAEVEKLLARVVAAERGGAPRTALDSLSSSHARLRAALRGISHADVVKSVESMHLSELVQDRRMLCEAVAALVDDPAHTDPSSPAGQRLATLLSARHDTVRGFFNSALKPMHMMFAAYERHDNARWVEMSEDGGEGGGVFLYACLFVSTAHASRLPSHPTHAPTVAAWPTWPNGSTSSAPWPSPRLRRMLLWQHATATSRLSTPPPATAPTSKPKLEATEPCRDTFGARSLRQLTAGERG